MYSLTFLLEYLTNWGLFYMDHECSGNIKYKETFPS
jgi:hypothetical protein